MLRIGTIEQALRTVQEEIASCRACASAGQPSVHHGDPMLIAYMRWVVENEARMRNIFDDPTIYKGAQTTRYWYLAEGTLSRNIGELRRLVDAEIDSQARRLEQLAARLQSYITLADRPGEAVFPDTNILLHYQRIDMVNWPTVVDRRAVRLVIPLVVLDELDRKRYSDSGDLRKKARKAFTPLDVRREDLEVGRAPALREATTVEYLLDEPGHRPVDNADEEILDRAEFFADILGRTVTVVTGDTGMRARAAGRGGKVRAATMPLHYRDRRPEVESGDNPAG